MGWLIELLFGAVKELLSQFIVDMMDVASSMFTEILSCDLNLFEELFGVAGDLYKNAIMPLAVMLLLMILVWQLFKSMFGKLGTASEDPFELIFRSTFSFFMIAFSKDIVNYILEIAGTPFEWMVGTGITVDSFSQYVTTAEAVVSVLGIDVISIQLLLLIMHFVVAWNYFKMLFILAERYVLLGIFSYTAPLAFATGGSKATNNIQASWTKMFGGQVLIVILDAWCLKMFLSGYGNLIASSYGFTKFFAATMCLIGFCKISVKLDSYMGSLGVNLGRINGGLSGMGALFMAGRLLHSGGGKSGGSDKAGAACMTFGNGKPIPLGSGTPDFGAAGMSGMQNGAGVGGTAGGPSSGGAPVPGENFNRPGNEGSFDGFEMNAQGMEGQNQPFGMPQEDDFNLPDDFFSGVESTEGMEAAAQELEQSGAGVGPFQEEEIPGAGSFAEAGELPGMEAMENGPFGSAADEAGMDMETEQNAVSGIDGAEQAVMDMPVESDGISGMQAETEEGAVFGTETAGQGIMSYGGDPQSASDSEGFAGAAGTGDTVSMSGGIAPEESASAEYAGAGAAGTAGIQAAGTVGTQAAGIAGEVQTAGTAGEAQALASGMSGNVSSSGLEQSGNVRESSASGVGAAAGASYGADGVYSQSGSSAPGMEPSAAIQQGFSGQNGVAGASGAYAAERDGEHYMRYDAGRYEKPQGAYQTIHENGKTFYELPDREKAPQLLPETKATLEKDGTLHLEKVYRETVSKGERKVPEQKPEEKKKTVRKLPGRKRTK